MIDYLKLQKDFSRHKKIALKQPVREVISKLKENEKSKTENDEDEEPIPEDIQLMTIKDTNSMNKALLQNYAKQKREDDDDQGNQKKKAKKSNKSKSVERPTVRYSDLGGIDSILQHLGVDPPRGVLLHGPPGTGKTSLALAIAGELGLPFIKLAAPEIVSGMSGESEARVREIFEEAKTAQREMERRIVAQLLTSMDELSFEALGGKAVMIIGATNRPDSLDPALRRAGRFDREIRLGIPDDKGREKLAGDFDFFSIAKRSPGFVGADLRSLTREAAINAVNRIFSNLMVNNSMEVEESNENLVNYLSDRQNVSETLRNLEPLTAEELEPLAIEMNDFEVALKKVQPSAKREGFAVVPGITWDDIGALDYVREELRMAIVEPIKNPEMFSAVGINSPAGVLLYGPPGTGKTLLAKAIANESHCNFISVKGPELLNKYVGESERSIRQVFERAKSSAPCVIFFDEIDALCPKRNDENGDSHSSRIVNQLLTEMDGMEERSKVFIIAATNRPDMIDPAMTRPGRLDKLLFVSLPSAKERFEILKTLSRKTPLHSSVSLNDIAFDGRCEGYSGADLSSLLREASIAALRQKMLSNSQEPVFVAKEHFEEAFSRVFPSVSKEDQKSYEKLQKEFSTKPSLMNFLVLCSIRHQQLNNLDVKNLQSQLDKELAKYPPLLFLEKKTGVPKVHLTGIIVCLVLILVIFNVGGHLIVNLVGFVYPAYATFLAIESKEKEDDTQWLTYWMVFAAFSIVEFFSELILYWIPFYYLVKATFLYWLFSHNVNE
ncbi:AAA+ ATPase domain-containing protein [Rozella allomycis CSF55]|uniref:Peroxisomal ATPase PEX1 n=1 Tax=Rozella allomycis (strain CSF55) TaxID=988480 RepID=A0A075ATX0_ROZAC|nr:AAA+ ATPase domain-containing protein [Rozella allomycis CSF55]|eukprot:EPZ32155.1 AAA+ ATPase domain-containing protein [Rozella allomycis CSF55]